MELNLAALSPLNFCNQLADKVVRRFGSGRLARRALGRQLKLEIRARRSGGWFLLLDNFDGGLAGWLGGCFRNRRFLIVFLNLERDIDRFARRLCMFRSHHRGGQILISHFHR